MNTENTENTAKQDIGSMISEYQNLVNVAERKLRKYWEATENRDAALEEWEMAQEAADEALIALCKLKWEAAIKKRDNLWDKSLRKSSAKSGG